MNQPSPSVSIATPGRHRAAHFEYLFLAILWTFVVQTEPSCAARFEESFTGATMRLEILHFKNGDKEHISFERLRVEGPWSGSRARTLDRSDLGDYRLEVVDLGAGRELYSRGFSSVFNHWADAVEAPETTLRSLPESLRFPEPRRPFEVRFYRRGADGSWQEIWRAVFDPASRFVDRTPVAHHPVWTLHDNGPAFAKVDLLFLGDGYSREELPRFHADVGRLAEALFQQQPFASHRSAFNVRAVDTPALQSGISPVGPDPAPGSPLRVRYIPSDSEHNFLTFDDRAWREVAAAAPYDFVLILVNSRQHGGGGIYQLYATVAAGATASADLLIHAFGHHFAALCDEHEWPPAVGKAGERPSVDSAIETPFCAACQQAIERIIRSYTQ